MRIWDPATGQQRATLTGHTGPVSAVAIAPDGTWLASGGRDGSVRIWDPATGQQRAVLTGHTGAVTAVAIAPDGTWLATASDDRIGADLGPDHRRHQRRHASRQPTPRLRLEPIRSVPRRRRRRRLVPLHLHALGTQEERPETQAKPLTLAAPASWASKS